MLIFGEILNSVMVEICVICKNAQQVCADCYQGNGTYFYFWEVRKMVILGEILNSVMVGICEI